MSSNSIARKVEKLFFRKVFRSENAIANANFCLRLDSISETLFREATASSSNYISCCRSKSPFRPLPLSLKWTNGRRHEKSKSIEEPYLRFIKHWTFHWRFPIKSNFHQSKTPTEFDFQMIYEWKASRIQNVYRFFNSKSKWYETVAAFGCLLSKLSFSVYPNQVEKGSPKHASMSTST